MSEYLIYHIARTRKTVWAQKRGFEKFRGTCGVRKISGVKENEE
jgi:hypothetical protein